MINDDHNLFKEMYMNMYLPYVIEIPDKNGLVNEIPTPHKHPVLHEMTVRSNNVPSMSSPQIQGRRAIYK